MKKSITAIALSMAVSVFLLVGIMEPTKIVKAISIPNEQSNYAIDNNSKITNMQVANILDELETKLKDKYQGIYTFDNFQAYFTDSEIKDSIRSIDIDIIVDMTLIRNPKEAPYVKGMIEALSKIEDEEKRVIAEQELNDYLEEVMPYYNVPDSTTFSYRIEIPMSEKLSINSSTLDNYKTFYRTDITDSEVDLVPVPENETFKELGTENEGEATINQVLESKEYSLSATQVTYNKDDAITYAKDHAKDEPEFSKANGMGSDCANFVSKSINAGGIPVDKTEKWYPSPKSGSYAGENWMRTGYYDNGGVVPYMVDKGYFTKASSSSKATKAGIMSWNSSSHVALVVSNDGTTIKYSQHSNVKQTQVTKTYSSSDDVTFYNAAK